MNEYSFFRDNTDFIMFGTQHLLTLLFFFLIGYSLIKWAKKLPEDRRYKILHKLAVGLSATVIIWIVIKVLLRGFVIEEDLPFHLCNIMALLLPIFTATRKRLYFEVLFFWILAGTSHALITPDLLNGFPNFIYFKYWLVHAGLIIFVFYGVLVLRIKPTLRSVFVAFFALQLYIILMFTVNAITGANYFYTQGKPEGASALDYLGEYPHYIWIVELIMIPYFMLFYLPFYISQKKIKS